PRLPRELDHSRVGRQGERLVEEIGRASTGGEDREVSGEHHGGGGVGAREGGLEAATYHATPRCSGGRALASRSPATASASRATAYEQSQRVRSRRPSRSRTLSRGAPPGSNPSTKPVGLRCVRVWPSVSPGPHTAMLAAKRRARASAVAGPSPLRPRTSCWS